MIDLLVGIAIGVGVFWLALRVIRLLATPPPPEPNPEDVAEVDVGYRCTICGLRLTVTHAQDGDWVAPKHCREEMVAV
jgi:hypothetical protein